MSRATAAREDATVDAAVAGSSMLAADSSGHGHSSSPDAATEDDVDEDAGADDDAAPVAKDVDGDVEVAVGAEVA